MYKLADRNTSVCSVFFPGQETPKGEFPCQVPPSFVLRLRKPQRCPQSAGSDHPLVSTACAAVKSASACFLRLTLFLSLSQMATRLKTLCYTGKVMGMPSRGLSSCTFLSSASWARQCPAKRWFSTQVGLIFSPISSLLYPATLLDICLPLTSTLSVASSPIPSGSRHLPKPPSSEKMGMEALGQP